MALFSKRLLSIDMGNHSVKIIEAQRKPDFRILKYGIYPAELFTKSSRKYRILKGLGYRTRDSIISFHHHSLLMRTLSLPISRDVSAHELIQEIIREYEIDFKEDFDFGYSLISTHIDFGYIRATTAALAKRINRMYIQKADDLGLRLKSIAVQVCSVQKIVDKYIKPPYILIDIGHSNTTIGVIGTVDIMAKVLDKGVIQIKNDYKDSKQFSKELITTCHNLLDAFYHIYPNEAVTQGIIYGGGSYFLNAKKKHESY